TNRYWNFIKTQRERPKQTRRLRRGRSKLLTQEKRIRRESSTSTRSPFSLLSHAQQRSSAWAGTSPTISKKDQQASLLSQYHFSNHQPHWSGIEPQSSILEESNSWITR